MHSSHFLGITPCSCHDASVCVFSCVLTALTCKPGHNTAHYSLWWVVIPVWSWRPCLVQPCGPKVCFCFDVRGNIGVKSVSLPRLWGAPSSFVSSAPCFPPCTAGRLLSWAVIAALSWEIEGGNPRAFGAQQWQLKKKKRGEEKRKKVFQLRWKTEEKGGGGVLV